MENIKIYENAQFGQVRTQLNENGDVLFCLKDVCQALGIKNHKDVVKRIDEDGVDQIYLTDNLGRNQLATFVSEAGLYEVVLRSESPQAKPFRKWVCSEVLPSIRKHGAYATPQTIQSLLDNPIWASSCSSNSKRNANARKHCDKPSPSKHRKSNTLTLC